MCRALKMIDTNGSGQQPLGQSQRVLQGGMLIRPTGPSLVIEFLMHCSHFSFFVVVTSVKTIHPGIRNGDALH